MPAKHRHDGGVNLHIRISSELNERLVAAADERDVSVNFLVGKAIVRFLGATMKAVKITSENQRYLANRYATVDLDQFPIGLTLVTDFGDNGEDRYCGVVSDSILNSTFVKGSELRNGFFEITRK